MKARTAERLLGTAALAATLFTPPVDTVGADDWPGWRGPQRDGTSRETGLLERWPSDGPSLVWTASGLGEGYSSLAVQGSILVTLGTAGKEERVIALDVESGERLWSNPHGPIFRNDKGDGPRGTPTVDGNRVYALGANGTLSAFDLETGGLVWSLDILRRFRGRNIRWGLSESPLVVGDLVLVTPGGRGAAVVALDRRTGEPVWTSESDRAGYSSGVLAEIEGVRQAVFFTADRALGLAIEDGRLLWDYGRVANRTANAATPIVAGDRIFVSSDYGTGCALLRIAGGRAHEVYFSSEMRNHHSSSVLLGEHLYGFSSSILTAMELATGEVVWRDRSVGKGSLIAADGHLYLLGERREVALAEATPNGYREKSRFTLPKASSRPTWSHPALANGRLFLRDQDVLYAYDVKARE